MVRLKPIDIEDFMASEDPPVALRGGSMWSGGFGSPKCRIMIDTYYLRPGEDEIITERIKRAFKQKK